MYCDFLIFSDVPKRLKVSRIETSSPLVKCLLEKLGGNLDSPLTFRKASSVFVPVYKAKITIDSPKTDTPTIPQRYWVRVHNSMKDVPSIEFSILVPGCNPDVIIKPQMLIVSGVPSKVTERTVRVYSKKKSIKSVNVDCSNANYQIDANVERVNERTFEITLRINNTGTSVGAILPIVVDGETYSIEIKQL